MSKLLRQKIRHLRKLGNLSIKQLSNLTGIPFRTLQQIEYGQTKNPSIYKIYELSKVFGCSVEYLVNDKYNLGTYPDTCNCNSLNKLIRIENIIRENK